MFFLQKIARFCKHEVISSKRNKNLKIPSTVLWTQASSSRFENKNLSVMFSDLRSIRRRTPYFKHMFGFFQNLSLRDIFSFQIKKKIRIKIHPQMAKITPWPYSRPLNACLVGPGFPVCTMHRKIYKPTCMMMNSEHVHLCMYNYHTHMFAHFFLAK